MRAMGCTRSPCRQAQQNIHKRDRSRMSGSRIALPAGVSRRAAMASLLVGPGAWLAAPQAALAGGQLEEPLIDSVRSALTAAIGSAAPPEPVFVSTEAKIVYLRWLGAMVTACAGASLTGKCAAIFCRPSGMKPGVRASMNRWCWASSRSKADSASSRCPMSGLAAICR